MAWLQLDADFVAAIFLFAAAAACVGAFFRSRAAHFLVFAAAFLYLDVDEAFGMHERLGTWIEDRGVRTALVRDADTFVLAAYATVLLALIAVRWRELARPALARWCFLAATLTAGVSLLMDARVANSEWYQHAEEYFEAAAAGCLAVAFAAHATAAGRIAGNARGASRRRAPSSTSR